LEDIIETDRIQDDEEELEINHDILIFIEENFFNRKEIQDNLRKIREIIKKEYQKNIELLSKDTEDLDKLRNAKMSLML
jgi:ABC-type Zn uptake system ZnuABC Zn-binding protein ZnuA